MSAIRVCWLVAAGITLFVGYSDPPPIPPAITTSTQDNLVFVGDTVTCTVQGGKPLVTAVHINCTNLQLKSTTSTIANTSVSRSVTISTLQTTDNNTTCYCWATWEPEPGLYTHTSQESFQTGDKAEVHNFTINQHPYSDTVTEGVTFICEASGHPSPALHISFGSEQVALSQHTSDINATEDTPLAAIVGGVVGGILVLTTAAVVGVLIWMKRNPRYEKPLPRRERESDAYTGLQPSSNDTDRQTSAGIANHQLTTDLDEENCLHNYQNLSRPDNTYDPLQMTGRQDTAVYTELRTTGPGGRGTDKAEVHNFTVNQRPHSDTVTEGDTSVTFICKASGYPTPTLRITFGSTQVSQSEQTSADKITSQTVLTYTIPRVNCDDKGNYTCTADNGFTGAASVSVQLNMESCDEDLPAAAIVGGVSGVLLVLTTAALVGVLIWMKRNPRYETPLPRRERKSDAYTGLQPPDNNTDQQSTSGIVNPQLQAELDESDRLHSYQNVLSQPGNTYDPLQMTERQNTAVYMELRSTGPGGRETGGPFDLDSECMESEQKTDRVADMVAVNLVLQSPT
ncbi:hypothetical protein BaRGS_00011256, partial [Batillaria attramentaria]